MAAAAAAAVRVRDCVAVVVVAAEGSGALPQKISCRRIRELRPLLGAGGGQGCREGVLQEG